MKFSNFPSLLMIILFVFTANVTSNKLKNRIIQDSSINTTFKQQFLTSNVNANKTENSTANKTKEDIIQKNNNLIIAYFNLVVRNKLFSLYKQYQNNTKQNKTNLKNEIKETNLDFEMELKKYTKILNALVYFLPKSKNDLSNNHSSFISKIEFVIKILLVCLKLSLFLIFINIFRWYEKIYSIVTEYIESHYANIEDLTNKEFEVEKIDENHCIFISGKPVINKVAVDNVFEEIFQYNNYAKIERVVEFYNSKRKIWETISNTANMNDFILGNFDNPYNIDFYKDNHIQISFDNEIFTFPRLFSDVYFGEVSIRNIILSNSQLKSLKIKEPITFNDFKTDFFLSEKDLFTEKDCEGILPLKYKLVDNSILFYPRRVEESKHGSIMKVSFYGYKCEEISILAKVMDRNFKTYRTPYDYEKEMEEDKSFSINNSTNMIANIEMSYFSSFLCCCFYIDGHTSYIPKDEYLYNDNKVQLFSINWVKEAIYTKEQLINEKHNISVNRQNTIRLIFVLVFFVLFTLFNDILVFFVKFFFSMDFIETYNIIINIVCSVTLDVLIIVINKISYKASIFFQLLFCFAIYIFLAILLVIETLKLLEKIL